MVGNLWKIYVKLGDVIEEGQEVVILEFMKMEILIIVDVFGMVKEVKKMEGDFIDEGEVLIEF